MHNDKETLTKLIKTLREKEVTIAVADNCLMGHLLYLFRDIPEAYKVFTHGYICNTDKAMLNMLRVKESPFDAYCPDDVETKDLGITENTLAEYRRAGMEVSECMAWGALNKSGATFAISITGSTEAGIDVFYSVFNADGGVTYCIQASSKQAPDIMLDKVMDMLVQEVKNIADWYEPDLE